MAIPAPAQNVFLRISPRLALGADNLQWVLYRYRPGAGGWRSVCFVHTAKRLLLRYIRENWKDEEAQAEKAMAHLPDTFEEWCAHIAENGELPRPLPPYPATP